MRVLGSTFLAPFFSRAGHSASNEFFPTRTRESAPRLVKRLRLLLSITSFNRAHSSRLTFMYTCSNPKKRFVNKSAGLPVTLHAFVVTAFDRIYRIAISSSRISNSRTPGLLNL